MGIGLRTTSDGTLISTLGKSLYKSIKINGADLKDITFMGSDLKEVTFSSVPEPIKLYIDYQDDDHCLTIDSKCSIEAKMISIFLQTDSSADYEIWLWK